MSANAETGAALSTERCNHCIDRIQQALDSSLGTTGNLSPDDNVVEALQELLDCVRGVAVLNALVEPLEMMIRRTEEVGGTFNTADTLLVQEAVIGITLGVDSIANGAPVPDLIAEVTSRIEDAARTVDQRVRLVGQHDELMGVFVEESTERLEQLYELLQRWRSTPRAGSRLTAGIRRCLHNLKGAAGSVGLVSFATLIHQLETAVASCVEVDTAELSDFFALAMSSVEALQEDVDNLQADESVADHKQLLQGLSKWGQDSAGGAVESESTKPSPALPAMLKAADSAELKSLASACAQATSRLHESQAIYRRMDRQFHELSTTLSRLRNLGGADTGSEESALSRQMRDCSRAELQFSETLAELGQSMQRQGVALETALREVDQARLAPLQVLQRRLVSVAEDTARAFDKEVALEFTSNREEISGELLLALSLPIEQLVQNAIVHGIELPDQRQKLGKPQAGRVLVDFQQTRTTVKVQIEDDGAGVDMQRVSELVEQHFGVDSRSLKPTQLLEYLVLQGVSTRAEAGVRSGRGVGLDTVLSAAAELRGSLRLETRPGIGVSFILDIPRRHYWEDLLIVCVGDMHFALPRGLLIEADNAGAESAGSDAETSLAELLGLGGTVDRRKGQCFHVSVDGVMAALNVGQILSSGRKQVYSGGLLIRQVPGILGVAITDGDAAVPVIDIEYWFSRAGELPLAVSARPEVLVVEDSSTMRTLIARALSGVHCDCVFAHDAVEADSLLAERHPAMVLLDVKLPRGDGFSVARSMRRRAELAHVPIVFTTSLAKHVLDDLIQEVLPAGYLEKPYTADEVARLVAGVLSSPMAVERSANMRTRP